MRFQGVVDPLIFAYEKSRAICTIRQTTKRNEWQLHLIHPVDRFKSTIILESCHPADSSAAIIETLSRKLTKNQFTQ